MLDLERQHARVRGIRARTNCGGGGTCGCGGSAKSAPTRCPRHPACELVPGHGGGCDPRTERQRARRVIQLSKRLNDDALLDAVEREAAEALDAWDRKHGRR